MPVGLTVQANRYPQVTPNAMCLDHARQAEGGHQYRPDHNSLLKLGQGGSSNALSHSLKVIVSRVELDLYIRFLNCKDLFCYGHHKVASVALGDSPENHDVINLVTIEVLTQAIAKIDANRLVDLASLRLLRRILHGCLDQFQALRMGLVLDGFHVWMWVHLVLWSFNATSLG